MIKYIQEYVNWFGEDGLQAEICDEMGINMEDFRRYHNVIGGNYKDLWHLWLWYVDHRVHNGCIVPHSEIEVYDFIVQQQLKERWKNDNVILAAEEGVEWIVPFFDAIQRIFEKYGDEYNTLMIYYYW